MKEVIKMKAKDLEFMENMALDRIAEKISLYKNNKTILNLKEQSNYILDDVDYDLLELKNKKYKEYIMVALNLKTDKEFNDLIKNN